MKELPLLDRSNVTACKMYKDAQQTDFKRVDNMRSTT
jgi:hypothetical protein